MDELLTVVGKKSSYLDYYQPQPPAMTDADRRVWQLEEERHKLEESAEKSGSKNTDRKESQSPTRDNVSKKTGRGKGR